MQKKRIILAAASGVLAIGLMCGCSSAVTDTASLVKASEKAMESVETYHVDNLLEATVSMKAEDQSISIPMTLDTSVDTSKESAHGTMLINTDVSGKQSSQLTEMYYDYKGNATYVKPAGSALWTKTESAESIADMVESLAGTNEELLKSAEFKESEKEYELTFEAEDLKDVLKDTGLLDGSSSGLNLSEASITDGEIVYAFDKESDLLNSIKFDDIAIEGKGNISGTDVSVHMDIDGDYTFTKYNELEKKDYEIPGDVKKSAQSAESQEQQKATTAATQPVTQSTTQAEKYLPPAETEHILDGAKTPNGQGWFVVGVDGIPAGTYKLFHGNGQGILTLQDMNKATDNGSLGSWSVGYDAGDKLEDGTQVTLQNEDLIFMTDGLQVIFDPVHAN